MNRASACQNSFQCFRSRIAYRYQSIYLDGGYKKKTAKTKLELAEKNKHRSYA